MYASETRENYPIYGPFFYAAALLAFPVKWKIYFHSGTKWRLPRFLFVLIIYISFEWIQHPHSSQWLICAFSSDCALMFSRAALHSFTANSRGTRAKRRRSPDALRRSLALLLIRSSTRADEKRNKWGEIHLIFITLHRAIFFLHVRIPRPAPATILSLVVRAELDYTVIRITESASSSGFVCSFSLASENFPTLLTATPPLYPFAITVDLVQK